MKTMLAIVLALGVLIGGTTAFATSDQGPLGLRSNSSSQSSYCQTGTCGNQKSASYVRSSKGNCPTGNCPTNACPTGNCPTNACPTGTCPTNMNGACPTGNCPTGTCPTNGGACATGNCATGGCPRQVNQIFIKESLV